MKLTKGKISKLYNKKSQSLKKYKKLKSSYKKRTFRNKRKVNLARKSLKKLHYRKYRGGEGDDNDTPKDNTNETINTVTADQPISNNTTENPVTETSDKSNEGVLDIPIQPTEKISTSDVVDETDKGDTETSDNSEGVLDIPIQPTEKVADTVTEEPTDNSTEGVLDVPIQPTEKVDDTVTEEPIDITENANTNKEPTNTTDQSSQELTLTTGDVADKSNTELINSFKTIANYIADTVSEKVSMSQSGEKPQEGFEAVNKAAKTMASSGGSKFKKTRCFRLTKKNKTRHL